MKYDIEYFYNKFNAIPEDKWTTGTFKRGNRYCALGHCGARIDSYTTSNKEVIALSVLYSLNLCLSAVHVNDGAFEAIELGNSPKERILNALVLIDSKIKE